MPSPPRACRSRRMRARRSSAECTRGTRGRGGRAATPRARRTVVAIGVDNEAQLFFARRLRPRLPPDALAWCVTRPGRRRAARAWIPPSRALRLVGPVQDQYIARALGNFAKALDDVGFAASRGSTTSAGTTALRSCAGSSTRSAARRDRCVHATREFRELRRRATALVGDAQPCRSPRGRRRFFPWFPRWIRARTAIASAITC